MCHVFCCSNKNLFSQSHTASIFPCYLILYVLSLQAGTSWRLGMSSLKYVRFIFKLKCSPLSFEAHLLFGNVVSLPCLAVQFVIFSLWNACLAVPLLWIQKKHSIPHLVFALMNASSIAKLFWIKKCFRKSLKRRKQVIMDMASWSFCIKILAEECWECAALKKSSLLVLFTLLRIL